MNDTRIPITVYLSPAEYRAMTDKAEKSRMQVRQLIEASIARSCRPTEEQKLRRRVDAIVSLHAKGLNDRQIADELGITMAAVYHHRHVRLHLPKNDPRGGINRHTKNPKERHQS